MTTEEAQAFLEALSREKSVPISQGDVADLARRNPEDVANVEALYRDQYDRRAASTEHRGYDSQAPGNIYGVNADPRTEPGYGTAHGTYFGNADPTQPQNQYLQRYLSVRPQPMGVASFNAGVPVLGAQRPGVATGMPVSQVALQQQQQAAGNQYQQRMMAAQLAAPYGWSPV